VSLFPLLAKALKDKEESKITHVTEKASLFALALALPLVSGGILIAKPLINVVYGYAYIGAVSTFQILLLALIVVFPGVILSDVIFVKNKQKMFIKASLIGALINVTLDLLLIPHYGIAGSAIATLCAQVVMNGMFFSEITKSHHLRLFSGSKNIFIATICMSLITYISISFSLSLMLTVLMSSIIYIGILFVLREPLLNDVRSSFRI
jgi:O-antigen/teichoic acid export membrane protein